MRRAGGSGRREARLAPGGARQAPWRRGRQAGCSGTSRSWPRGAASGCHVHIHVRASGWWPIGPGAPNWRAASAYIESHRITLHSARRLRRPARGSRNSKGCFLESLRDEKASAVNFCHCYSRRGALRRASVSHTQRPPPRASPVSLRGREARAVRVPRCAHARLRDARARAGAVNFAHSFVYSATQLLVWWLRSFISFLSIERKFT